MIHYFHHLDIKQIRNDFPILNQKINEYDLIYFDNAATTQKPKVGDSGYN